MSFAQTLKQLANGIDRLNEWVGRGVSWLTTALVGLTVFDVLVRYLFNQTQAWIMELEWHLFALVFLFGAGYALLHDRHVRVDLFYSTFTPRQQAQVDFWGTLLLLLPWTWLIGWATYPLAMESYRINEGSPDPGGLPFRYVIKFALLIGFSLLLLQGVSRLIRTGFQLWGPIDDES